MNCCIIFIYTKCIQGKPLDRLNADKLQSVSSVLDFFGDNLQQDGNITTTADSPMESSDSKDKEKKKSKRRRNSSKDLEEAHQAKRSKLKQSTKVCLIGCDNIRELLYQVMMMKIPNQMSVIQMTMMIQRLLHCYQVMPHWIQAVASDTKQREKSQSKKQRRWTMKSKPC